jgi:hypothetical protein
MSFFLMPSFISALKAKLSSASPPEEDALAFRPACLASNHEPNTQLTSSFSHELGAHGWGNAELQNYTASDECSFMRDGRLVVCGHVNNATERYESARLRSQFTLADGPGGKDRGFLRAKITAPVASTSSHDCSDSTCNPPFSGDLAGILASPERAVHMAGRWRDRHPRNVER